MEQSRLPKPGPSTFLTKPKFLILSGKNPTQPKFLIFPQKKKKKKPLSLFEKTDI